MLAQIGNSGRLSYVHYRSLGIPLGSGAIESSIRRVINLRLKNNGMFWREPEAEMMLQVRAQLITDRWTIDSPRCVNYYATMAAKTGNGNRKP